MSKRLCKIFLCDFLLYMMSFEECTCRFVIISPQIFLQYILANRISSYDVLRSAISFPFLFFFF